MINKLLRKLPHNRWNQRWGINTTMTLKASDGDVYLFRRRLIQTPLFGVYLHDVLEGDEIVENLHSHPFPFVSMILRGGYTEKVGFPKRLPVAAFPHEESEDIWVLTDQAEITHRRWGLNVFPRGAAKVHTIIEAKPQTKTLVLTGRRKDSWGWFVEGHGIVHWSEFLIEQGREIRDVRITKMEKP